MKPTIKPKRTAEQRAEEEAVRRQHTANPVRQRPAGAINRQSFAAILSLMARFKALRESRGLTLADVAERMGIDAPALSRLETGKMLNPTLATLHKWAEALGRKLDVDLMETDVVKLTGEQLNLPSQRIRGGTAHTSPHCIDDQFIETWHRMYADKWEQEYQRLVSQVEREMQLQGGALKEQTLYDILKWKWTGLPTKTEQARDFVGWPAYLKEVMKAANQVPDDQMQVLDNVPFIGPPVASTILAFMFPSSFPIFDRRTADVLRHFGYIKHNSTALCYYPEFRQAVLTLQASIPKWTLHEIDKAMFAYHQSNPTLFPRSCDPEP